MFHPFYRSDQPKTVHATDQMFSWHNFQHRQISRSVTLSTQCVESGRENFVKLGTIQCFYGRFTSGLEAVLQPCPEDWPPCPVNQSAEQPAAA